jgi:hypothetical protein
MASEVDICNSALSKLGASRITDLTDNSPQARACNFNYELQRDWMLRRHLWNFAIKRVQLAADVETPPFGFSNQYTLPADYLRMHPDNETQDYSIENGKLLRDGTDAFDLRYVARVEDTTKYDSMFVEALASRMAFVMAEELTQSNTKKAEARDDYKDAISEARKVDAIENESEDFPEDEYITARL